jgi:putative membrane-bound dehydrogenase-like protein
MYCIAILCGDKSVTYDPTQRQRHATFRPLLAGAAILAAALLLTAYLANVWADVPAQRPTTPAPAADSGAPRRVKVLFLGDHDHHVPLIRLRQVYTTFAERGIDFTYMDRLEDALNPANLNRYDVLFLYANWTRITPEQEKALFDFVESGHGFCPIHCGSACFGNSPRVIALMGAKFDHHSTGVFKETIVEADHPIEKGLKAIESWDETYVHSQHNEKDRTVLAYRIEGDHKEPWTWVRTQGKGRIFYTAWGHDERTWSNPDWQALIERGVKWAAGDWALEPQPKLKEFTYGDGILPNYLPGKAWGTVGDNITKIQQPIEPQESMKHMALPPGFEAKLFASEPNIKKPICMAFDERGRLWVAETYDYPNQMQAEGEGRDKITICEDTDGDGIADKFTVFADKLSIPTSMVFANGGVIVSQAPHMLFLKDTSGTGVATERRVLFTGFGVQDTHAGPSNLHWGLDGWIYATCGYSGFNGTVGGQRVRFGQGTFRFKPDGSKLEFLGSTNNNTWGLGLSEDFEVFISTANHNPAFYLGIPNRYFETVRGWNAHRPATIADDWHFWPITDKVRQVDQFGGYTAGAGNDIYTARTWPSYYWNRIAFVAEPTGHLIGQFILQPYGSGFLAVNNFSLMGSDDEWTAPIAPIVGPDGQVWFIDWYNIVVQHNPIPRGFRAGKGGAYESDLRDKRHGRVYRVVYGAGKQSPIVDLSKATPQQLVEKLKSDNMLWRSHAQRLLVERGNKDVIPALIALVNDPSVDSIGLNPAAIHALWAISDLGGLDGSDAAATTAAIGALGHKSAGVRKNALAVLPRNAETLAVLLKSNLFGDADPLVRKQSMLALSEMPVSDEAGKVIYAALSTMNAAPAGGRRRGAGAAAAAAAPAAPRPSNLDPLPVDSGLQDSAIIAAARHDAAFLKAVFAANPLKAAANTGSPEPAALKTEVSTNLVPNPSFETEQGAQPAGGWHTAKYGGDDVNWGYVSDTARTGKHSVKIESKNGVDAGWAIDFPCQPNTNYILSGWIKTDNVQKVGPCEGALLNLHVHQLKTNAVTGTHDWTRVELRFNSGSEEHLIVNCLFGGWGRAKGAAWYDDIEVTRAGAVPLNNGLPGAVGQAVQVVSTHYAQRGPTDSIVGTLSALKQADPALATAVIDGLAAGWPSSAKGPELSANDVQELQSVMTALPPAARDRLLVLGTRWGRADLFGSQLAAIAKDIKATLNDETQPPAKRAEAAKRLIGVQDDAKTVESIVGMIKPTAVPELQAGLIDALSASHTDVVGDLLVKQWKKLTPASQKAAVAVMLRKPAWTASLLNGLDKSGIDQRDIANEQWQALTTYPDERLAAKARVVQKAVGRPPTADRREVVEKFIHLADEKGDIEAGKQVFEKNCRVCHTLDGAGGKVGPELTGVGARPKSDILMQILDPNRSVEGTFREWTATTKDGEFVSGRLMTETATTVELIDATGKNHLLQRSDLKNLTVSERGVMPEGFESLKPEELRDVVEFVSTSKVKP